MFTFYPRQLQAGSRHGVFLPERHLVTGEGVTSSGSDESDNVVRLHQDEQSVQFCSVQSNARKQSRGEIITIFACSSPAYWRCSVTWSSWSEGIGWFIEWGLCGFRSVSATPPRWQRESLDSLIKSVSGNLVSTCVKSESVRCPYTSRSKHKNNTWSD